MLKDLIVEIFVPQFSNDGCGEIATGIIVSQNRILTVRHVFSSYLHRYCGEKGIEFRCRHPNLSKDERERWWPVEKIIWENENRWDLALLACQLPRKIPPPKEIFNTSRPREDMQWTSMGFPRVGGKRENVRQPFHMQGKVYSMLDSDDHFDVTESAGPSDAEAWRGASGSPVLVNSSILGIIISVPPNLQSRRLKAVPIWQVLAEDPEFCNKVGYEVHKDHVFDQPWVVQVASNEGALLGTGFFVSHTNIVTCYRAITVEQKDRKSGTKVIAARPSLNIRYIQGGLLSDPVPARLAEPSNSEYDKFDIAIYQLVNPIPNFSSIAPLASSSGCKDHPIKLCGFPSQYESANGVVKDTFYKEKGKKEKSRRLKIFIEDSLSDHNDLSEVGKQPRMRGAPIFDIKKLRVIGMYIGHDEQLSTECAISVEDIYQVSNEILPIRQPPYIEEYLTALARACEYLPYVSLRQNLSLTDIYVAQHVAEQMSSSEIQENENSQNFLRNIRVDQVINESDKTLIIGAAGAGKSSMLRYLVRLQLTEGKDDDISFFRLNSLKSRLPILISLRGLSEQRGDFQTQFRKQIEFELGMLLKSSLPLNFIDEWQQQAGVGWLILLDGLDEIVPEEKRILMSRVLTDAVWPIESKIIVTTRPLASLSQLKFENYYLRPFNSEQIKEFAYHWFLGNSSFAKKFQNEVISLRLGSLKGTPLAITISAKVFESTGTLSGIGRVELYERYLNIVFKEEDTHNNPFRRQFYDVIGFEYGDRIFSLRREIIEEIALAQHEGLPLNQSISEYLIKIKILQSQYDAERKCEIVLDLVSRSTSLFNTRVAGFNFEHLTFREYFCASAIVRKADTDSQIIWDKVVSKWADKQWKEVSLFILGILSIREQTKKIAGDLVHQIFNLGGSAFFFVLECMADRIFIEQDVIESVFSKLNGQIDEARLENGPIKLRYIYDAIIDSINDHRVAEAVQKIALDSQFDYDSRIEAARSLSRNGFTSFAANVWIGLLKDQELEKLWYRSFTPHNLIEHITSSQRQDPPPWWHDGVVALQEDQSTNTLLELAADCSYHILVRLNCATALEKMGQTELAGKAWVTLAQDKNISIWWRNLAVEGLARLNKEDDLRVIIEKSDIPDSLRTFILRLLKKRTFP